MASKITYDDKVSLTTSALPRANKCTDDDLNEIKEAVNNNADETDANTTGIENLQQIIEDKSTYSTTEKQIGTWIDGKPIYRKTFSGTYITNNTRSVVDLSTAIDTIVNCYGLYAPNSITPSVGFGQPMININGGIDAYSQIRKNNDITTAIFTTPQSTYQGREGSYLITIEYTKIVD